MGPGWWVDSRGRGVKGTRPVLQRSTASLEHVRVGSAGWLRLCLAGCLLRDWLLSEEAAQASEKSRNRQASMAAREAVNPTLGWESGHPGSVQVPLPEGKGSWPRV